MTKRKGAKKQVRAQKQPTDNAYQDILVSYWNGDFEYCKAEIVSYLYGHQFTDTAICLYRLWIEIHASEGDESGLRLLLRHTSDLASSAGSLASIFYAFAGLIHLELDEIEAASLMARGLKDNPEHVYSLELFLRLEARTSTTLPRSLLLQRPELVFDYAQFEAIAGLYWQFNKSAKLKQLCQQVEQLFPDSPLILKTRIADYLNKKQWKKAYTTAESLYQKYPSHRQSVIFYSASLALAKEFDASIFSLERLQTTHQDAEFLTILSYSYCQRYQKTGAALDLERAQLLIARANKFEQRRGAISFLCSTIKARIDAMSDEAKDRQPKVWMVQVNAKSFHQLRTEFQTGKFVRKPLGSKVFKGDICIFVYQDQHRSEYEEGVTWRFGAIASVADNPEWHPLHRYQSQLRIEMIPAIAVPLDIKEDKPVDPSQFSPEDPRRYRAFELDDRALSIVDESLQQFAEEYESYSDTMSHLRLAQ